ncbi:homing endonuclease associated repeat-containing protein [Halorubrum distributum]|uniref:homing endonuclease associated repeat-containing protein n=1 Tax=Halorubrum distributum TaxID=29283 RepID=UPI002953B585|nr:DEAD/DEAH box helicase family protein [Halorubrum distributum]
MTGWQAVITSIMDPFKNQVDDRTSYTDLDEQFYDARLSKNSLTQGDWPSQIDRAAIDVTYGVALGTTDAAFDHGATIGRIDFGTACGSHYVDGLQALAGSQSDLPQLITEYDASDIGDLVFRLNELRVELTKLGLDDSEIGDLNRATEALIEKLITQHGDEELSRQPLQQPEAVADLLYQLFSDPAVTNYADILIDSITADTGSSIGGDSLLTHLDRPQMVTRLWDHQQRAIKRWVDNGTTGYVNMATATGKTVLGLAAIAHLFGDLHPVDTADIPAATRSPTGRATVLIVAGQDLLLEQWQSEFDEHLNIPRSRTETGSDGDRHIELAWGDIEFRTAQELLAADPGLHYDLVILDEAHRYSSGRRGSRGWRDLFDDLTTNADSVLAMSGSIDDEWLGDSGVKDALEANLSQCIEFGITEAREQNVIADFRWDVCYAASNSGDTLAGVADSTTTLTPTYDTNTHKFTPQELSGDVPATVPDTFETLRDLRSFAQSKDGKDARDQSEAFDTFATAAFSRRPKRWQLNPPHDIIGQLLTEHVPDRKAVVLVQSYAQADAVSEYLVDYFDANTVYTPAKDEAAPYDTITAFKQADAGVLVGPGDVLGVGVDLPDAGIAVNLAKGGVNASLIQRIGRILRNPTGDKHAHFYHVVTIPGEIDARIPGEDGRRLLRRASEFRALGSRFREHPGFVAVSDTTRQILRELETAGARATIADNRDTSDMVDDDVARSLLDELIDEIESTLDEAREQPVLTTYWQPESLTPGIMPVQDSVSHTVTPEPTEATADSTPTRLTVTVTDTGGEAIKNAAVIAETTTDSAEQITDADGTVTITLPTSGSDPCLFVSRAGYQNQTHDIPGEEDTVTITLPNVSHTALSAHTAEKTASDTTTEPAESSDEPRTPSRDELRTEIQRVDGVLAGYPTLSEMDTHSRYASARYTDAFESWTDALHAADIDPDQRVISDVQRVADQVDGVPTMGDIATHSHFTPATLGEHFGSFDAAIAAAGVHDSGQSPTPSTNTAPEPTESNPTATQDVNETADTTSTSSSTSNPDTITTRTSSETSTRDDLISELRELASDWDEIDRKLLYSVGDHHPDEYKDAFGSLDAALVKAGVADEDTVETFKINQSSLTEEQEELITELQNLARDWDKIDRKLLYSVGSHHPDEYEDAFGSIEDALIEAGLVDAETVDKVNTRNPKRSQPPDDHTGPVTGTTGHRETDQPVSDKTTSSTSSTVSLPDGRVDKVTITVLEIDSNPGSKRDACLQVELQDGSELPLDIWTTHNLSLDWTIGATYTIEQARHKRWETDAGTGQELSSTKDFQAKRIDTSSRNNTSDSVSSSSPSEDETSSSGETTTGSSGTPTRRDLLDAVQHVAGTFERPLKATDVSDATQYSVNDITRVFGSWQNCLDAAGIDNEARLIEDLHRVANELGHKPSTAEMNEHGHVTASTIANYFDTYTAATEQAFDKTKSFQPPSDPAKDDNSETSNGENVSTDTDTGSGELRDVNGVTDSIEQSLRQSGFDTRSELKKASVDDLAEVDGVSKQVAMRIKLDVGG